MSHTSVIKTIPIRSVNALKKAVEELSKKFKCELIENQAPRMYFSYQFERDTKRKTADYVLKLQGWYDLGFVYDKETDQYNLIYDDHNQEISRYLGRKAEGDQDPLAAQVSLLTREYAKFAAIESMESEGYTLANKDSLQFDEYGNCHVVLDAPQYEYGY